MGVHRTYNLDDDYMGSGTKLLGDMTVLGKKNFERTILKFFDSEEEMYKEEALIVNKVFIQKEETYNIVPGGRGGSTQLTELSRTDQARSKKRETLRRRKHQQGTKNSRYGTMWITNGIENKSVSRINDIPEGWKKGRAISYNREYRRGEAAVNYGTMWVNNGKESKQIESNKPIPEGWKRGLLISLEKLNSQKMWITNGIESKFVYKESLIPNNWRRGRK